LSKLLSNEIVSYMGKRKHKKRKNLGDIFDKHVKFEFIDHDVEATMKTMVNEPIVHNVPIMTGGIGFDNVFDFYKNEFVGKMPDDTKITRISRTVGKDQVVDELILCFTHDIEIKSMLPRIPPTGRYVELPHVVVMKFEGSKILHEHIYWDQASLLVQVGLIDSKSLPVTGIEQARNLLKLSKSSRKKFK
jgi:carboxymethylenebutenolidase